MTFTAKLTKYRATAEDACTCWDHLRAAGLTPPKDLAHDHRDCLAKAFRVDNGKPATTVAPKGVEAAAA